MQDDDIVEQTMRAYAGRTPDSTAFLSAKQVDSTSLIDTELQLDMRKLRGYRLARLQAEIRAQDAGCVLLYDPINVRYATGSRNMTQWIIHNPVRYCLVPAEGRGILFEYPNDNCLKLAEGLETLRDIRKGKSWTYFSAGEHMEEACKLWADEIAETVKLLAGGNKRIGVDRLDLLGVRALDALGFELMDGQGMCERARAIKSREELQAMAVSMAACDIGMARMREALRPGMTENELWAELHHANIALGGEWIETRLLSSGGRTNPWFQESSDRRIRPGDLVSFDTDMIGPLGYCADVSRTFFCGPGKPSETQRRMYGLSMDQIHHNLALIKPGLTFREFREKSWQIPARYGAQKYTSIAHGVGLCDEWPAISYETSGRPVQDGILEPGMVICIESYIGEAGGAEGVKLEQQVQITDTGYELQSTFPFEDALLA